MSTCLSAEEALNKGNQEFIDKNYKSALEMYNLSIELDENVSDAFLKRALCYEKLKNFKKVLEDANHSIRLDPMNLKAYYQKGVTSYEMGEYKTAQESFEKCLALDRKDSFYPTWVEKCKAQPSSGSKGLKSGFFASPSPSPSPSKPSPSSTPKPAPPSSAPKPTPPKAIPTTTNTSTTTSTSSSSSSSPSSSPEDTRAPPSDKRPAQPPKPPAPKAPKAPRAPKFGTVPTPPKPAPEPAPPKPVNEPPVYVPPPSASRYTWYQTDNFVVVTVFVKAAKPTDVNIDFEEKSLSVNVQLSADNQFLLDLDLASDINPAESKFEIMSTKIEIKLKKVSPVKWGTLERKEVEAPPAKKEKKNWDQIMAGEEEDKSTDFTQLMKDMYTCASEEERRAMMKSFHESGGTVLSADWKDVGKGYVDPKPPVGVTKWDKDA